MKICILTPTFLPQMGGAEICIDQLAKQFTAQNHKVTVLSPYYREHGFPAEYGYPVYSYRKPLSQYGLYWHARYILRRLYQQEKFDILNVHEVYPSAFIGLWFSHRYKVPMVVTPHGGDIFYRSRFRKRPVIWRRISRSLDQANAVIALSAYCRKLITEIAPNQKNIVNIGNGVNNAEFAERNAPLPASLSKVMPARYFLGIGRLVPRKGFDMALKGYARVAEKFSDLYFVLAGDGPERKTLENLACHLNIEEKVIFTGAVRGPAKVTLFRRALFTIVPSIEEDNMPLVVMESMACGKPVLGSNLGGIPDILVHEHNGRLFETGNIKDFTENLLRLINDVNIESMSKNAVETAAALDWALISAQYINVFERMVR